MSEKVKRRIVQSIKARDGIRLMESGSSLGQAAVDLRVSARSLRTWVAEHRAQEAADRVRVLERRCRRWRVSSFVVAFLGGANAAVALACHYGWPW